MGTEQSVKLYATRWCFGCRRARDILSRYNITFDFIDIDQDAASAALVEQVNHGFRSVPTLIFPDGTQMTEPRDRELMYFLEQAIAEGRLTPASDGRGPAT